MGLGEEGLKVAKPGRGICSGLGGRQLHDPLGTHGLEMGWHGLQEGT